MAVVSNPDKVLFPDAGFTKADVVGYYEQIGPMMLTHLAHRPLTLVRYPDGIGKSGFMQKNTPAHFPPSIRRFSIPKRSGGRTEHSVIDTLDDLLYLANQASIEFHITTTTVAHPDRPDRLALDLDPPEGGWALAAEAAHVARDTMTELGLRSGVMTTGSKGFHVVAPITPTATIEAAGRIGQALAVILERRRPDLITSAFRLAERGGRVFADWLRNRPSQTGIAPWSLRARPGAPVAVPIEWHEVVTTQPDQWTLATAPDRPSDPLASVATEPSDPTPAIEAIEAAIARGDLDLPTFDRFRS